MTTNLQDRMAALLRQVRPFTFITRGMAASVSAILAEHDAAKGKPYERERAEKAEAEVAALKAETSFKANFLFGHADDSIEFIGYEFANAKSEAYRKECWEALTEKMNTEVTTLKGILRDYPTGQDDGSWIARRDEALR